MIPNGLQASRGIVLRKIGNALNACSLFVGGQGRTARFASFSQTASYALGVVLPIFLFVLLAALAMLLLPAPDHAHLVALGGGSAFMIGETTPKEKKSGTPEKKPAKIREMEANLKALAKELEQGQLEMTAGPISPERGEELEAKAQEMEELQGHLDRYNRIAGIVSESKKVDKVTLPGDGDSRTKRVRTTPGHLFVLSQQFKSYRDSGKQGWSGKLDIPGRLGSKSVVLTGDEAIEFERKAFDPNTLSDLGTDVIIETARDQDIIRYEEPEILTIRDVLGSSATTSDSIRYVRHTATTRAAASQNPRRGGLKGYLDVTYAATSVNVETIAVLSKVTEQDVDDAPRLVGAINGEMQLDIKVEEERQLLRGTGTNGEIAGLFDNAYNVPEFDRAQAGDTIIDLVRRMRTDLRKVRVQPNFVTIDPIDWEDIELQKGTDTHYLWGMITDLRGPRIWSLRVVESDAMTDETTGERRILMGDGIRGATVYDRHDVRFAIGYVDDDFARNLRTLRAEERLALAVKRDWAFLYAITAAGT